jgi:predicted ABC-type ATPase
LIHSPGDPIIPQVVILAGPDGAGKTTFAFEFLPNEAQCTTFLNPDLIATGVSPLDPAKAVVRASRILLEEVESCVTAREDFAFETTLSGRAHARRIPEWRAMGYRVVLIFLRLPSVEMAISRVAARVVQGGHDVAEPVIRRRFSSGLLNLERVYKPLVDSWAIMDTTGVLPYSVERDAAAGRGEFDDWNGATTALERAFQVALDRGYKTRTPMYAVRDGKIVDLTKEPIAAN